MTTTKKQEEVKENTKTEKEIVNELIEEEVVPSDLDYEEEELKALEDFKDDEEELWENGPTVGELKAWKAEHKKIYISSLTDDDHVVWHPIKRSEYKQHIVNMERATDAGKLSQAGAQMYHEESLCKMAIVFPDLSAPNALDDEIAGMAQSMSQDIMAGSGFGILSTKEI